MKWKYGVFEVARQSHPLLVAEGHVTATRTIQLASRMDCLDSAGRTNIASVFSQLQNSIDACEITPGQGVRIYVYGDDVIVGLRAPGTGGARVDRVWLVSNWDTKGPLQEFADPPACFETILATISGRDSERIVGDRCDEYRSNLEKGMSVRRARRLYRSYVLRDIIGLIPGWVVRHLFRRMRGL